MNKQNKKTKLTAKKRHNTNKTLKRKNLVAGYGLKTKSSKKRTNTRRTIRPQNNEVPQEGDNQEEYVIPPAYPPIPPYSQPEISPIPPYVPPTPYEPVKPYVPPPAYEPIQPYTQPEIQPIQPYTQPEITPIQPYTTPTPFAPIPPFQNPISSEEQLTSPVIQKEEPVTKQEEPVIKQEEPVIKQITNPSIPAYVPPPAFEPIPAYVQPSEIPPVQPYVPPPAFEPIPPFQNQISPEEPEISVINPETVKPEDIQNGFTETIIQNNQPPINNTINVELCPTIIEVGKNINHKYMFPSQFPVITNFYKQISETNKKRI